MVVCYHTKRTTLACKTSANTCTQLQKGPRKDSQGIPIMYNAHPGFFKRMDSEHNRRQLAPIGVKLDP